MVTEQDQRISDAVEQERSRLGNFIRRHVPDKRDAEDVLQEVFYELVEATRNLSSIEQLGAWLFQVARNRITDLYRRKRPELKAANEFRGEDDGEMLLDSLPSPDAGPEAAYARTLLMDEIEDALEELPPEQREVFVSHEIEGYSFKEISAETGVGINTLLSRKRYAVLHLRKRLQAVYREL